MIVLKRKTEQQMNPTLLGYLQSHIAEVSSKMRELNMSLSSLQSLSKKYGNIPDYRELDSMFALSSLMNELDALKKHVELLDRKVASTKSNIEETATMQQKSMHRRQRLIFTMLHLLSYYSCAASSG